MSRSVQTAWLVVSTGALVSAVCAPLVALSVAALLGVTLSQCDMH